MTNLYSKRYNHLSAIAVVLILLCLFLTSCSGAEVIRVEEQKKAQIETYKVSQTEETVSNTEKNSFRISKEEDTKSRMLVLSNIKIDYSQLQVLSPYESIELLQGKGLIVTGIGSPNRVKTYNSSKFNTIKGYTSKELDLISFTESYGVYKLSLDFAYSSTYKNEVINLLYTYKTDGQRVVLQRDLQGNEVLDANWDTLDIKVSAE